MTDVLVRWDILTQWTQTHTQKEENPGIQEVMTPGLWRHERGEGVIQSETERTQSYQPLAESSKCPPLELLGEHSPAHAFSKYFQAPVQGEGHTA